MSKANISLQHTAEGAAVQDRLIHMLYEAVLDNSLWPEMISELLDYVDAVRDDPNEREAEAHSIAQHFERAFQLSEATVTLQERNATLSAVLDGLAIGPVIIAASCFCLISYLAGHFVFAQYLQIHFVPSAGELSVFCGALIGASIGFLWFNAPPAMIFMGDTGSLSIGAALGSISLVTKHEIVLAIIGGLFVVETISVIIQVGYYKMTKKRIFLMAPIHHHFEKLGWSEPTIVIRFWIIASILALIGLSTLKLR